LKTGGGCSIVFQASLWSISKYSWTSLNPFKILAEAEPRLWRGEATIAQNPNSENWRGVVDDVRTYWQTATTRLFIPSLSLNFAKIN